MTTQGERKTHIVLHGSGHAEPYTARSRPGKPTVIPALDRQAHAADLRAQLGLLAQAQREHVGSQQAFGLETRLGMQVEFKGIESVALAAEKLARERQGITLMNVRKQGEQILATVFVPKGKLQHFEGMLTAYVDRRRGANDRALDHQPLIDAIESVRAADFDSIWTDHPSALPPDQDTAVWWEAWLPAGDDRLPAVTTFRRIAEHAGMSTRDAVLDFPERAVICLHGSRRQIEQAPLLLHAMAELRRAKDTAEFFDSLAPDEQADWTAHLLERIAPAVQDDPHPPCVTLLDTGVNRGHPLLQAWVSEADLHAVDPAWTVADENGHGTELAGLALFGDLMPLLAGDGVVEVTHRVESVKVLRQPGDNEGESHGALTAEAVARVEVSAPHRQRVFSMAVTASDGRDRGRPSSWSAELDRLAYDAGDAGHQPRLFVVSAGNVREPSAWAAYPDSLATHGIQDPAQAWNALTVGAYTQLDHISETNARQYRALAPVDALSPYSTTSLTWAPEWPFKPDVVLEGGNVAIEPAGFACPMPSLSLVVPHHVPQERQFSTSWATSAATALAAGMAARVRSAYPAFWPETVRGLLVHSARWTPKMLATCLPARRNERTGRHLRELLRTCGYGVPSLDRALWSAGNSLTLIVQDELQPYVRDGGAVKTKEMHFHDLPWPEDVLHELGEAEVRLRVTLSYFIEPNPGARGQASKYSYQSHALRFAVRRPTENDAEFRRRINAQADDDDEGRPGQAATADRNWFIGDRLRRRGSLLSDIWTGPAAELANLGQIAVFPAMGWWKTRSASARYERTARYALLVSIEAPEIDVDLYTVVQNVIEVRTAVEVAVSTG